MAERRYVARFPVSHGVGGETTLYDPGDELDMKDFTDEQVQGLVAAGSVLPKDVADALLKAEEARNAAAQAQADAQAKADNLASELMQRDRMITEANVSELRNLTAQPTGAAEKRPTPPSATTRTSSGSKSSG